MPPVSYFEVVCGFLLATGVPSKPLPVGDCWSAAPHAVRDHRSHPVQRTGSSPISTDSPHTDYSHPIMFVVVEILDLRHRYVRLPDDARLATALPDAAGERDGDAQPVLASAPGHPPDSGASTAVQHRAAGPSACAVPSLSPLVFPLPSISILTLALAELCLCYMYCVCRCWQRSSSS